MLWPDLPGMMRPCRDASAGPSEPGQTTELTAVRGRALRTVAADRPAASDTAPVEQIQQALRVSGGASGLAEECRTDPKQRQNTDAVTGGRKPRKTRKQQRLGKAEDIPAAQIPAHLSSQKRRGLFGRRTHTATARDSNVLDVAPGLTVLPSARSPGSARPGPPKWQGWWNGRPQGARVHAL